MGRVAWQASEAAAAAADGRQPVRAAATLNAGLAPALRRRSQEQAAPGTHSQPYVSTNAVRCWGGSELGAEAGCGVGVAAAAAAVCSMVPWAAAAVPPAPSAACPCRIKSCSVRPSAGSRPATPLGAASLRQRAPAAGMAAARARSRCRRLGPPTRRAMGCTASSCVVVLCPEVHQQMHAMCQFKVSSPGRDLDLSCAAAAGWRRLAARRHELGSAPCRAQYCILLAKPAGSLDLLSRLQRAQ